MNNEQVNYSNIRIIHCSNNTPTTNQACLVRNSELAKNDRGARRRQQQQQEPSNYFPRETRRSYSESILMRLITYIYALVGGFAEALLFCMYDVAYEGKEEGRM
jgi:hypothetical protein